jgi:hypothetical protein
MKKQELQALVQECISEVLSERFTNEGYDEFQRVDKGFKGVAAKDKAEEDTYGAGYAAGEKAAKAKYKKLAEAYKQLKEEGFGIGPRGMEVSDDLNQELAENKKTLWWIMVEKDGKRFYLKNSPHFSSEEEAHDYAKQHNVKNYSLKSREENVDDDGRINEINRTNENVSWEKESEVFADVLNDLKNALIYNTNSNVDASTHQKNALKQVSEKYKLPTNFLAQLYTNDQYRSRNKIIKKENIHNTAQMGGVTTSKGTAGYINNPDKKGGDYDPKERAANLAKLKNFGLKK